MNVDDVIKLGVVFSAANHTTGAFNHVGRQLDKVSQKSLSVRKHWQGLSNASNSLFNFKTAGVAIVASQYLKLGAGLEKTRISFKVLMGYVSKGNAMIANLNHFANSYAVYKLISDKKRS